MIEFVRNNARWLLACILMYFSSCFGQTFFISLYATEIRTTFNLTHGQWGSIYAAGTLLSASAMLVFGGVVDKFQLRKLLSLCMYFSEYMYLHDI